MRTMMMKMKQKPEKERRESEIQKTRMRMMMTRMTIKSKRKMRAYRVTDPLPPPLPKQPPPQTPTFLFQVTPTALSSPRFSPSSELLFWSKTVPDGWTEWSCPPSHTHIHLFLWTREPNLLHIDFPLTSPSPRPQGSQAALHSTFHNFTVNPPLCIPLCIPA